MELYNTRIYFVRYVKMFRIDQIVPWDKIDFLKIKKIIRKDVGKIITEIAKKIAEITFLFNLVKWKVKQYIYYLYSWWKFHRNWLAWKQNTPISRNIKISRF